MTSDIAIGIRTPIERAEEIKKHYGCAYSSLVKGNEYISVPVLAEGAARSFQGSACFDNRAASGGDSPYFP